MDHPTIETVLFSSMNANLDLRAWEILTPGNIFDYINEYINRTDRPEKPDEEEDNSDIIYKKDIVRKAYQNDFDAFSLS